MNLRAGPFRDIIETLILALLVFLAAREAVQNFQVEGSSMFPTLHNADFVLVNKLAYQRWNLGPFDFLIPGKQNGSDIFHGPKRGDVVVLLSPQDHSRDFVKRIIGEPGDTIEIVDGQVFVNDHPLAESAYIAVPTQTDLPPTVVPPDHYFVMGDNRNASSDSRSFGPVPRALIIGKVWFRWYPFDRIDAGISHSVGFTEATAAP